jgi:predicted GIY-YIG superfamily endonuclease
MSIVGLLIYKMNKITGKIYIGQTTKSLEKRMSEHRWSKKLDDTYTIDLVVDYLTREEAAILEKKLISQSM